MKTMRYLAVIMFVFLTVAVPEQASAQLFRRWAQEDNSRDSNLSQLPGMNQMATQVADYGANQVSEDIRNEVNGRTQVLPAPDFNSNGGLAFKAKQYRNPVAYSMQKPVLPDNGSRVQPPLPKSLNQVSSHPRWLAPYETAVKQQEDIAPKLEPETMPDITPEATPLDKESPEVSPTKTEEASLTNEEQPVVGKTEWNKGKSTKQVWLKKGESDHSGLLSEKTEQEENATESTVETTQESSEVSSIEPGRIRLPALTFGTMLLLQPLNISLKPLL